MTNIRNSVIVFTLISLLFRIEINSQSLKHHQAVAAYLYNFAKNVRWENENRISEFKFHYVGNNESIKEELESLAKLRRLRDKPIKITYNNSELEKAHLVFISKDVNPQLVQLYDRIEGKNILLVSEEYSDKKLIMINLTKKNESLHFEINKANIINQNIEITDDLILLGGTEIDVASLYRESQQTLRTLQKHADKLEENLINLERSINAKSKEIELQKENLEKQSNKLNEQNKTLSEQSLLLKKRDKELSEQLNKINEQNEIYEKQSKKLEEQKEELAEGNKLLNELKENIEKQKNDLAEQSKALEEQSKTIGKQQEYLHLLIIIVALVILLSAAVYIGYKNKIRLTKELEIKVQERTNELKKLNEELEERVNKRTDELQRTNKNLGEAKKEIEEVNKYLLNEIDVRKKVQADFAESEKRLEAILNYAPILVYINDVNGKYIFVNYEFEKVMKLKFEEVVNKNDLEIFPKQRAERNIAQNKKVIETGKALTFENPSQKEDGLHYFFDIIFPIFDSNNKITATCGWTIDITDRKKREEVLKEAKDKAESADKLKSAFLATMSHELRTPLNSIIGFTGILLKGIAGPLNSEQIKQLGLVKGSAQHLLALINDVLDISKIEAGQLVVSISKVDFRKTLTGVVESIIPSAEKKSLEVYLSIADEVSEIESDERRVGQIFLNLVNNAIKFTNEGFIKIDSFIQNGKLITKVMDSGIGIKEEDKEKLFKPFSQIDTGLSRNHEGTGLGLSITKKLVEKLGGKIYVESSVNKGSTFIVEFPNK